MPLQTSSSPGREVLSDLYESQQQSYADIARRYGVTKTTVKRWLRAAGISARDISTATSLATKGKPKSEAHRIKLAENAEKARAALTDDSFRKISESNKGRAAPNKGKTWTDDERAKHMAYRKTPEYREKLAAAQRGEKAWNWQGGKTPDSSLHGWEWRLRRREVYERDTWTCQDCGCKCLGTKDSKRYPKGKIQAHHLVSRRDGGTDDLSNLVTLCMSCHHKRERRSKRE